MSNRYIKNGTSKELLLKKLSRCSENKKALIREALEHLDAQQAPAPEPVVEVAPAPEPVVEVVPEVVVEDVVEEPAPAVKPKRTYRRRKTTKAKSKE
jgi:hypothetical protein